MKLCLILFLQTCIAFTCASYYYRPAPPPPKYCFSPKVGKLACGEKVQVPNQCEVLECLGGIIKTYGCGKLNIPRGCKAVFDKTAPYPACCNFYCEKEKVVKVVVKKPKHAPARTHIKTNVNTHVHSDVKVIPSGYNRKKEVNNILQIKADRLTYNQARNQQFTQNDNKKLHRKYERIGTQNNYDNSYEIIKQVVPPKKKYHVYKPPC